MTRYFTFLFLIFFYSASAYAGSNGCSGTSSLSWYQADPTYTFASSDCIIDATQADQADPNNEYSLMTTLPASPSDGDQFTLVDTTPYSLDDCASYYDDPAWGGTGNTFTYCSPAGIGFQTTTSAMIGNDAFGYGTQSVDGELYYTACVDPENNPCSLSGYPIQQRDADLVQYNAGTGNWDLTISPAP